MRYRLSTLIAVFTITVGTLMFGILSWLLLEEIPTLKTIISLLLAISIILIQLTNVIKI